MATIDDLQTLDIRVGKVLDAEQNHGAHRPAYVLRIDLGQDLGVRTTSAQLCDNYTPEKLVGRLVLAVVNLPPRRVNGVRSEVLVLAAVCPEQGAVLIGPERPVSRGAPIA